MAGLLTGFILGFLAFTDTGHQMGNMMAGKIGEEVKKAIKPTETTDKGGETP